MFSLGAPEWSLLAILDFYGGYRWLLVPRLQFPVPRFSNIRTRDRLFWFKVAVGSQYLRT